MYLFTVNERQYIALIKKIFSSFFVFLIVLVYNIFLFVAVLQTPFLRI